MSEQNLRSELLAEAMIVRQIDTVSQVLGVPAHVWMTTMVGRTACRGLDAQVAANISQYFYNKLVTNIKNGDTAVADMMSLIDNNQIKMRLGIQFVQPNCSCEFLFIAEV